MQTIMGDSKQSRSAQAERCRRLASSISDPEAKAALKRMADEYEDKRHAAR
jgi:hypothetical protein